MKKTLLLFWIFWLFLFQNCLWADNCICAVEVFNNDQWVTWAWGIKPIRVAATMALPWVSCEKKICPWDHRFDYYNTEQYTMKTEISKVIEEAPQEIDNLCEQFTNSFSNEKCKELVERTKETEEYKEFLEKYNKEQENIKKQKELEEKQKELEEKQSEIEEKQKELEEKQSQILESQENIVTTETVEKIVEEKVEKKMTEEISKAKKELWDKAVIFESLVKLFKQKDQKTQNNVKALLKTFAQSKDEYTRNIWIYFGYLVE